MFGVEYGAFGVFWSALYFGVGALAGAQQEFARMTRSLDPNPTALPASVGAERIPRAIGAASVASVLVSAVSTVALAFTALRGEPFEHAVAIGVGFAFFGLYAVLLGMQYGARRWRTVAIATVADPLLRIALITVVVEAGGALTGAIWAAVAPFPVLAAVLLAVSLRDRSLILDKAAIPAARAAAVVVAGGVASSFIINGVPMLFALVAPGEDPAVVSRYVFAFILIRAPLVVGALALQSFLIVHLRDHSRPNRMIGMLVLAIVAVTGLGALLLAVVGEPIVRAVGGAIGVPTTLVLVGIAVASGATSALIVVGCWALARERRRFYAAGWWAAALSLIILAAVLPGDVETRITVASAIAPVVGVVAVLAGLRARA
ncbi:hypothetical protein [Microcella alkalica]|uniref:O-antigen/teichoic acid export membrane protein n=1 Tax=Microcella alkalica TaxID=355930 RepID=A0A839EEX3_9MICO|nr:hypothetical protein [Microcella alkalica]MBA8848942.1 O-antigen/teichoic acid export membrane protein [Microcella alkalica]